MANWEDGRLHGWIVLAKKAQSRRRSPAFTSSRASHRMARGSELSIGDQERDIWIWNLERQTLNRLTTGGANDLYRHARASEVSPHSATGHRAHRRGARLERPGRI